MHSADVLGTCFLPDKDDFLALFGPFLGDLRAEDDLAARGAGNGVDALDDKTFFEGSDLGRVDHREENAFDIGSLDPLDGLLFGDELFFDKINGNLECGDGASLAGAALQHVQLAFLDGELEVLHVLVMLLELLAHIEELLVSLWILFLEIRELDGSADTGDDILALGVDEIIAVECIVARVGGLG